MQKLIGISYNSKITGSKNRFSETTFYNESEYSYIGQNGVVDIIEHTTKIGTFYYDIIDEYGEIKRIFNPIEAYYKIVQDEKMGNRNTCN